ERALDQLGADTLTAEFWRHLGMDEGDDAVCDLVIGRGYMAVDLEFVAVMRRVVGDHVVHINPSAGGFPACCRLQNRLEGVLQVPMHSPRFKQTYAAVAAGLVG